MTSLALASLGLLDPGGTTPLGILAEGYLGSGAHQNTRPDADSGTFVRIIEGKSALQRSIDKLWAKHAPKRSEPKKVQRKVAKALVAETRELLHPLVSAQWTAPMLAQINVLAETYVEDPAGVTARAEFMATVAEFAARIEMMRQEEEEIAIAMLLAA